MISYVSLYYKLIEFISLFIKSKHIKTNIHYPEVNFHYENYIIYVLRYSSKVDLLLLRKKCLEKKLPDPLELLQVKNITLPRYIFLSTYEKKIDEYINLQLKYNDIDIKICLVSIFFGRSSNKLKKIIKKFFYFIFLKKNIFIYFSRIISLKKILFKYKNYNNIYYKLLRLSHIYFTRQKLIFTGPVQISKKKLFNRLFKVEKIKKAIQDESKIKKISYKKAKTNIIKIIKEISANFSYTMLFITDRTMCFFLKKLYHGINVQGGEKIRKIALYGNKIVYLPCHRSHMDYLLLSYVIYHQGLIPPHIVAGINLNFWPAGYIFRNLGAFFIRRSFKGNKLYTIIFKEYLLDLFNRKYSIECFIEGSRSRTGKLLNPKTGTLSVILQSILQGNNKSVVLLPVYIGYDHIIEENTYVKELKGAIKKKESLIQIIRSLLKLKNFGQAYVTFGEPLSVNKYFKNQIKNLSINKISEEIYKPAVFNTILNNLSKQIMIRINNSCSVNPINLCSIILLSENKVLTKKEFIYYINFYIQILSNIPYSRELTIPNVSAEILLENALQMNRFSIYKETEIIYFTKKQFLLMHYYRNNMLHTLALPSLIANIIYKNHKISKNNLFKIIILIYPLMKEELFLRWEKKEEVYKVFNKIIIEFKRQNILLLYKNYIVINYKKLKIIKMLSSVIQDFLKQYTVAFLILYKYSTVHRIFLEKKVYYIYTNLFLSDTCNIPEMFNKNNFFSLLTMLKNEGYIINTDNLIITKIRKNYYLLLDLLINQDIKNKLKKFFLKNII